MPVIGCWHILARWDHIHAQPVRGGAKEKARTRRAKLLKGWGRLSGPFEDLGELSRVEALTIVRHGEGGVSHGRRVDLGEGMGKVIG